MKQTTAICGDHTDFEYGAFLARINARFIYNVRRGTVPIFATAAAGLWEAYLNSFTDADERQHHTCHACRNFIERFGGLVTIDENGIQTSAIWHENDAPEIYKPAVAAMARLARRAKVTGVFLSSCSVWGQPVAGSWQHLSVTAPASMVTQTAGQAMAEKREDFKTVMVALNEFSFSVIEQAVTLLQTDSLYRSEKVLGQAEWLRDLHAARRIPCGSNLIWRAIATAPAGFCHPRSSMIGTLLEDIAAGMNFDDVSRRFAAKMHPLIYQRPQAAPTAGAIAAAEKLVEQMGIARSLPRRFARLDEVQTIWTPTHAIAPVAAGVFGHLAPKGQDVSTMRIPPVTMTWEKFQRIVLPTADEIEYLAHNRSERFTSLVTAVNADAPPILQWDSENDRNPVSWYFWSGGSTARQFGLTSATFHNVAAVSLQPSMWNSDAFKHHGEGVLFIIEGAKDQRTPSACLFPEILKSELHAVRSVIEAYSKREKMQGVEQSSAAGVMFKKGDQSHMILLRVTSAGRSIEYNLDRWD